MNGLFHKTKGLILLLCIVSIVSIVSIVTTFHVFKTSDSYDLSVDISLHDFGINISTNLEDSEDSEDLIIVNIWATWCEPCLNEIKELNYFYDLHNHMKPEKPEKLSKSVNLIGITYEEISEQDMKLFFHKNNISYPKYELKIVKQNPSDPSNKLQQLIKEGMPQTYIFDSEGLFLYRHLGELTSELLEFIISAEINQQPTNVNKNWKNI